MSRRRRSPKTLIRASEPAPEPRRWTSAAIAIGAFLVLIPTLAGSPQNGDGAEIIVTALRGGVMHPPGFPLQAWLDRLLVMLPGVSPAIAISVLSLVAHAGAVFFVVETLRLLRVGLAGRLLGAAALAFYPSVWALAVQPEVFSLAHLLIAAIVYFSIRIARVEHERNSVLPIAGLGLAASFAAAQHPIAITAIAPFGVGVALGMRRREHRTRTLAWLTVTTVLPAAALYSSLPLLRTSSPWPDWGALHSASGVLHHMMRFDYGTFAMSAATGEQSVSGLDAWIRSSLHAWHVTWLLLVLGAIALASRRETRGALASVGGLGIVGLLVLWRARLPEHSYTAETLARLQGPVALAGAILIGVGFRAIRERITAIALRRAMDGLALVLVASWLVLGWRTADVSHDRTIELHARGLALAFHGNAVYVTSSDVEAFLGIPTTLGVRFPVSEPLSSLPWYTEHVAPRLEPRVLGDGRSFHTWPALLDSCFAHGLEIYGTSRALVATPNAVPELRGLWYVAHAGATEEFTRATVAGALQLAPLAEQLPVLPKEGRAFSRFYARRFERAFAGAAVSLERLGQPALAARAESVRASLARGDSIDKRIPLLREFVRACVAAGF